MHACKQASLASRPLCFPFVPLTSPQGIPISLSYSFQLSSTSAAAAVPRSPAAAGHSPVGRSPAAVRSLLAAAGHTQAGPVVVAEDSPAVRPSGMAAGLAAGCRRRLAAGRTLAGRSLLVAAGRTRRVVGRTRLVAGRTRAVGHSLAGRTLAGHNLRAAGRNRRVAGRSWVQPVLRRRPRLDRCLRVVVSRLSRLSYRRMSRWRRGGA
jgi:hypothetical protein